MNTVNEMRVLSPAETEAVAGGVNWGALWDGVKTVARGVGKIAKALVS